MATADQLLSNIVGNQYLTIDLNTRTINIPQGADTLGVEYDEDVKDLKFRIPRYYGEIDLSEFEIAINYLNAQKIGDMYKVKNRIVNNEYIEFGWIVGRFATAFKGNVTFNVCLKKYSPDSTADEIIVEKEFNTTVTTMKVLQGLETGEAIVDNYNDILAEWEQKLFGESADGVLNINEAKALAIKNIQNETTTQVAKVEAAGQKAEDALAEVEAIVAGNEAYTKYESDTRYATPIFKEASGGDVIVLNDSSDRALRSLKLFGKTRQVKTTGKNLLPYPYYDTTKTLNGITFTDNGDGSITCNGTATATATFNLMNNLATHLFEVGESYILSGCPSGGSNTSYAIGWHNVGSEYGSGLTITVAEDTVYTAYIVIHSGATVSNLTFYPMVRLTSIEDATWEPYSGGIAAPNPKYPQGLISAGNDGGIGVWVGGKNLARINRVVTADTRYGITKTTLANTSDILLNGTATKSFSSTILTDLFLKAGTYTVSTFGANTSSSTSDRVHVNNQLTDKVLVNYVMPNAPKTFTINDDTIVTVNIVFGAGSTYNNAKVGIQIELGSVATEYEPYVGGSAVVSLSNGLPGILVESGGNYIDARGQQWICNYRDYERGVDVNYLTEVVFDGTDGVIDIQGGSTVQTPSTNIRFNFSKYDVTNILKQSSDSSKQILLCNYSKLAARTNYTGAWMNNTNDYFEGRLSFDPSIASTVEEMTALVKVTPLVFIVPLAVPVETPIPAEDLITYQALRTANPTSVIYNDSGVDMIVEYLVDMDDAVQQMINEDDGVVHTNRSQTLDSYHQAKARKNISASVMITEEASGDIVTVTDADATEVVSLITHIEPMQSGNGDPSPDNVRPISGRGEASVTRTGKNLLKLTEQTVTKNSIKVTVDNARVVMNGTATNTSSTHVIIAERQLPPGVYTMSYTIESGSVEGLADEATYLYTAVNGKEYRVRHNVAAVEIPVTETADAKFRLIVPANGKIYDQFTLLFQLEKGSTATAFEPYNGETLTAELPETVYGGTLNWTTGVLTVTHKKETITRMSATHSNAGEGYLAASVSKPDMKSDSRDNGLCETMKSVRSQVGATSNCIVFGASNQTLYIAISTELAGTTRDSLNAYLAENPLTVVYPLAEPYTIQLTPQQLETLKGVNNIWSDAGQTEVTYAADTKLYINRKIEEALSAAT